MNVHEGHRKRMREQYLTVGFDGFSDVQVLEYVLGITILRKDVNPLAHMLLNEFGSLSGVLDAPQEELLKIDGIGSKTAEFLNMLPQLFRRYSMVKYSNSNILDNTEAICQYIWPYYIGAKEEEIYMICLDAKRKVLDCRRMFHGSLNSAEINVSVLIKNALQHYASAVVLAHNHPWGLALPSAEDEKITQKVKEALNLVDIILADHIIVSEDECVSMADSGFLQGI